MSKRTLFLIFVLFVIASVLLAVALYKPSPQKPSFVQTIIPKESPVQTALSFGSLAVAISSSVSNLTYSVPINIITQKNKVTAVQLELQYDPLVLTNVAVSPGPFFKNPNVLLNRIDTKTGRISYAFGTGLTDVGIAGQGIVATLTFSAKTKIPAKTAIIFLPKTLVTAQGVNESVLKTTNNAAFTVGTSPKISP